MGVGGGVWVGGCGWGGGVGGGGEMSGITSSPPRPLILSASGERLFDLLPPAGPTTGTGGGT